MISKTYLLAPVLVALCATPALAAEYTFGPDSTVAYHIHHPLHSARGVSHQLHGSLKVGPDGQLELPLHLTVPVASFDSGNRNRDRNMLNVMNAARYPDVVLDVKTVSWSTAPAAGVRAKGNATGTLTMHGFTQPITMTVEGVLSGDRVEVASRFTVLLSQFAVERPSLLFKPIDDQVLLEVVGVAKKTGS